MQVKSGRFSGSIIAFIAYSIIFTSLLLFDAIPEALANSGYRNILTDSLAILSIILGAGLGPKVEFFRELDNKHRKIANKNRAKANKKIKEEKRS